MPARAGDMTTEVLVVGAGPAGLTLAHELTRRGVRVRLIDAKTGPAVTSRAIATHPRTLEIYDQMGVAEAMVSHGERIGAFTLFQNGTRLTRLEADYDEMPTRFPFTLCIDQVLTESVLRESLARLGVRIEWGVSLEDFEQDDECVQALLRHESGAEETVRVPYLAGCDGGHSVVRKKLGLRLEGESAETWLIADAVVDVGLPRDSIYWIRNQGLTMMLVPMSGENRWRLLDTAKVDHGADPAAVAARFSREMTAGLGSEVRVHTPEWISVFTFQQRMVAQMRVGRCFVTGDAAHVHSPASGQGMNTGIQEAYNLAWKLAMVVRGQAGERLLDTYAAERVPVGKALLRSTKKATYLVQLKNSVAGWLLPVVFGVVRTFPWVRVRMQREILGGISGLNLTYADSDLTLAAGESTGPRPGERITKVPATVTTTETWRDLDADLKTGRWLLAVAPGAETEAALVAKTTDTWLTVRTLGPGPVLVALGLTDGAWLLVRPDGYVSARGDRLTADSLTQATTRAHIKGS
ncbi:FAD-dependent monooxygenase [Amycolatopsis sp. cg5]|uniref:FAD-dependent monooxygenase n=1 Tax=Amycolatopsis sp. cg5 TaxID=3238802 RepID=UPI003524D6E8